MNETVRLLGAVQVSYAKPPQGYQATNLDVRVPYRSTAPLQVSLYAVKPVDSGNENRRIREIFATVIGTDDGEQRHDELFRLYQEAGAISRNRMERIKKQDDFNYLDAQILFKFMEVAVYLGREASLAMGPEVRDVRNFVRSQMQQESGKRVVLKGTSQSPRAVQDLLSFVDFVDADHLKNLWSVVKKQTNGGFSEEACKQYIAYTNTVTGGDYDQGLVEAWDRHKDYRIVALAAEAIGVCAQRELEARRAGKGSQEQVKAIAEAVSNLGTIATTERAAASLQNTMRILPLQ